jgi:hypothetical protein
MAETLILWLIFWSHGFLTINVQLCISIAKKGIVGTMENLQSPDFTTVSDG